MHRCVGSPFLGAGYERSQVLQRDISDTTSARNLWAKTEK